MNSVALTMPAWLAVGGSPITSTGTFAVTAATAQTAHQVIGTCGSATTFGPCALVAGDIPALPYLASSTVLPATTTPVASQFLTGYTASTGLYTQAQPTYANLGGTVPTWNQNTTGQAGTGNANDIVSKAQLVEYMS